MSSHADLGPELSTPASAAGDEVLYCNERTLVVRRRLPDGRRVIDKQAFGTRAQDGLRHEAAILQHLSAVPGVVRLQAEGAPPGTLRFEDDGAQTLHELFARQALEPLAVLAIAIDLARVLADVHRAGVIHKDINPSNIVLSGVDRRPRLIDFNIATRFAEERPVFTHQSHVAGTLAYMAPEQTGRTGRPVDQRSDLYALGATLYELTTGCRPFESEDLLDLIHAHLATVPTPPAQMRPAVPPQLSAIVMKLLEKEADARYQSADGLAHDLEALRDALSRGDAAEFVLGSNDFPLRLVPPARLIGRDAEVQALGEAVCRAAEGEIRAVLIAGEPGVGKSALIAELQPIATRLQGCFVSGKFDQYHQEATSAVVQALRALGRLILAEPAHELADIRQSIQRHLGANLGFGPCLLPEFSLLLGAMPAVTVDNPQEAEARMLQATLDLLRAVASPRRPLVMVVDDLQWAPPMSLRFIDSLLTDTRPIKGLLLIGAYRSSEVNATHPLSTQLARWEKLGVAPPAMELRNLPPDDTSALVGAMLRLPPDAAQRLGRSISARTCGNPYDTVELINALRHDGLLAIRDSRWQWNEDQIRRYVGNCDVVSLLQRRIGALPQQATALLNTLAALGGEAHLSLLRTASALPDAELQAALAPALEDGLLITDNQEDRLIRFRHDRVQQAVHERATAEGEAPARLAIARRLATSPPHAPLAAAQYLAARALISDAVERRQAVRLFGRAARLSRTVNNAQAERFLAAALDLMAGIETPEDDATMLRLLGAHHAALYGLARLDEADAVYARIAGRCRNPLDLVEAAGVQIASLSARKRHKDAVAIGLELLGRLGMQTPEDLKTAIGMALFRLAGWITANDKAEDSRRAELADERLLAVASLISKTQVAAFFCAAKIGSWLTMESHRLWVEHGPSPALMATLCSTPMQLIAILQDYRGAHTVARHLVEVGESRGYRPATAVARFLYALTALHWFEPIELSLAQYQQAREGLVQAGDLQYAIFTFNSWPCLLDSAPTLGGVAEEIDGGFAMAARSGDANFEHAHRPSAQLIKALRGETAASGVAGGFDDAGFSEAEHEASLEPSTAAAYYHCERALSAAIFGDRDALQRHSAAAMPSLNRAPGYYINVWAQLLRALALADAMRDLDPAAQAPLLQEFDACHDWIRRRAADAPVNYRHLQLWVEAERAWVQGDAWAALQAFDAAIDEAQQRSRPWHRALMTERAGLFHLAQGLDHTGRPLLADACQQLRAWGAAGKVRHMQSQYPFLRNPAAPRRTESMGHSTMVSSDAVDFASVLRASQALSSETQLDRLNARVCKVLSAMTGAASVMLVTRADSPDDWSVCRPVGEATEAMSLDDAVARRLLPISALRYAERTREPLLLAEATRDERFARDPCFEGVDHSSMLFVPVLSQGELRAVLVLENRLVRSAFSADRLDTVTMIAGQLAVSLDNAMLYASLERKVAERTAALEDANRRLEQISVTDALTGLANRRRFNEALEVEWLRARRAGTPLGLALIDVDHFKLYNDHYGHQAGDICLKMVADAMKSALRAGGDLVARWGGEEFVLLLPHANLAGAHSVAERVRAAVAARMEPHEHSALGIVTVSVGVMSCVPTPDGSAAVCIERADAALYEAKRQGRNRVAGGPAA